MPRLNVMEARKAFSETLNRVAFGRERIVLERRGKEVAALVPVEEMRLLERLFEKLEDREDVEASCEALKEGSVSLEDLKGELGL